jgi:hypothetical protein
VRTLELLAPVEPYDSTPFTEFWPAFLRGQASLHLKQPEQARMHFQQILEHRGQGPLSQLYPLASVGLARAAALKGDASTARAAYDHFFAAWPEPDSGLALVRDARQDRDALPGFATPQDSRRMSTR